MDFEDNNPFGVSDEDGSRMLSPPPSSHVANTFAVPSSVTTDQDGPRIIISEATKSRDGAGRGHITYTIRLPSGVTVRRRYSEFESLRSLLRRLFPCVVVPPIPEKHSLTAYALNPAHAQDDARVIEHRQRTLAAVLNRCTRIPQLNDSWVLERFLDPNTSWKEVLLSDAVLQLPRSPLQAPPTDPAAATPAHAFLPIPSGGVHLKAASPARVSSTNSGNNGGSRASMPVAKPIKPVTSASSATSTTALTTAAIAAISGPAGTTSTSTSSGTSTGTGGLDKRARRISKHYSALAAEYADFGGQLNSFSLDSHGQFTKFAPAVEKVGQAMDQGYISVAHLVDRLSIEFSEPVSESVQLAATARQVMRYSQQRQVQVQLLRDGLVKLEQQLERLQVAESEAERMNAFLHADERIDAATEGLDEYAEPVSAQPEEVDQMEVDPRDHIVDSMGEHDHDHEIEEFESEPEVEHAEPGADSVVEKLIPNKVSAVSSTKHALRGFKLPGFSHINHALHGMMDVDPQTARRNNITRTRERIQQTKAALAVAEVDAETAARAVNDEITRYNKEKREDIRQFVRAFINCHIEWAEKNLESWIEAKQAITRA